MAAFAIKASAVLCTVTMGIMARPRSRRCRTIPSLVPTGEAAAASRSAARPPWPLPPTLPAKRGQPKASSRRARGPHQQTLTRLDDAELNRSRRDLQPASVLAHHREARAGKVALVREILAKVRTPAVLALERCRGDRLRDLDQGAQVQPIVPG